MPGEALPDVMLSNKVKVDFTYPKNSTILEIHINSDAIDIRPRVKRQSVLRIIAPAFCKNQITNMHSSFGFS